VCKCGTPVLATDLDPAQAEAFKAANGITGGAGIEVPVLPAPDPAGLVEVWAAPDGTWHSRELTEGEDPGPGRARHAEHTGTCQKF
jgi:hypothetical protein